MGVYWLSDSLRRALRFEQQMQAVAAVPVELEDEATSEAVVVVPTATSRDMVGVPFPEPPPDVRPPPELNPDREAVIAEYDRSLTVHLHWCRVEGCKHLAPVPGDSCPIHKGLGIAGLHDGPDAA